MSMQLEQELATDQFPFGPFRQDNYLPPVTVFELNLFNK